MGYFSEHDAVYLCGLIDKGLEQLARIESEIREVVEQAQQANNPSARLVGHVLADHDVDSQFSIIQRSRAALRLVRAKLEIDEFSDTDAQFVCDTLDTVVGMGRELAAASNAYNTAIQKHIEQN